MELVEGEDLSAHIARGWIACASNEADGNYYVYVRPFPGPGGKWRISTAGGTCPQWPATARELLFVSEGKVMFAPYAVVGDSFRAEKPQVWSETGYVSRGSDCTKASVPAFFPPLLKLG